MTSTTRARLPRAAGAVAGQVTLAFGSFLVQLVAARALGPGDFGVFALLFGCVVMTTAVSSGLVGDSLTVLDRHDPVLRSALARTAAGVLVGAAALATATGAVLAGLSTTETVAFAVATVAFVAADLGRRLVMAALQFWRLVLADAVGTVAALAVLGVASTRSVDLTALFVAVAVGQSVACLVAVAGLPAAERARPTYHRGGVRAVVAYGGWRAVQQLVRPSVLNATRWLVLVGAGAVAVGRLEAARLLVAPALLLVQGVGSYLFASYAADRDVPAAHLLRRADVAAGTLLLGAAAVTAVVAAALPLLGSALVPGYDLAPAAILGWGVYAGSCAAILPYGSLAAVRGRQAAVLGVRVVDGVLSLAAVAGVIVLLDAPAAAAPWVLAVGSFVGGALCRQLLLVPMLDGRDTAAPAGTPRVQEAAA